MTGSSPKTIALTIGDVNGIGPEVVLKALRTWQPPRTIRLVVIAPGTVWQFWQDQLTLAYPLLKIASWEEWPDAYQIVLFDTWHRRFPVEIGNWSVQSGQVAGEALMCAARWAREGLIQAIVTAPVSKASFANLAACS